MKTFLLKIQTMAGPVFKAPAQRIVVRTIAGDVAIMADHCNYCTAIGMGQARVTMEDESVRTAACIGGMITMMDNVCSVLPTSWEWADEIDRARAEEARRLAEHQLSKPELTAEERAAETARLRRAQIRLAVAEQAGTKRGI